MSWGRAATVVACLVAGVACAAAQTLPWPGDPPKSDGGATGTAPASAMAAPAGPPPMVGAPPPPMMGGMSAPPQAGPPQQEVPPCFAEFQRLRGDVEKKGAAAKAVNDRKGSREDLCKAITVMVAAESKWVTYAQKNQATCSIPGEIVKQIKTSHDHMLTIRKRVCDASAAAPAPAAPSLSEALGTPQIPMRDNSTTKRGGTMDTLTGNPIR